MLDDDITKVNDIKNQISWINQLKDYTTRLKIVKNQRGFYKYESKKEELYNTYQ